MASFSLHRLNILQGPGSMYCWEYPVFPPCFFGGHWRAVLAMSSMSFFRVTSGSSLRRLLAGLLRQARTEKGMRPGFRHEAARYQPLPCGTGSPSASNIRYGSFALIYHSGPFLDESLDAIGHRGLLQHGENWKCSKLRFHRG